MLSFRVSYRELGMVEHVYNLSATQEVEQEIFEFKPGLDY